MPAHLSEAACGRGGVVGSKGSPVGDLGQGRVGGRGARLCLLRVCGCRLRSVLSRLVLGESPVDVMCAYPSPACTCPHSHLPHLGEVCVGIRSTPLLSACHTQM